MIEVFAVWLCAIAFYSVIITVSDKRRAQKGKRRISEKHLIIAALLGGSTVMYITMLLIRHKTKHIKFMLFLPLITVVHIFLLYLITNFS